MVFNISLLIFLTLVGCAFPPLLVPAFIGWWMLAKTIKRRTRAILDADYERRASVTTRERDAALRYFA